MLYRIVIYGKDMLEAIVPGSAKTFNFHKEYEMTEKKVSSWNNLCLISNTWSTSMLCFVGMFLNQCTHTLLQALRVSDHYPVEVELLSSPPFWIQQRHKRVGNDIPLQTPMKRAVTGKWLECGSVCCKSVLQLNLKVILIKCLISKNVFGSNVNSFPFVNEKYLNFELQSLKMGLTFYGLPATYQSY